MVDVRTATVGRAVVGSRVPRIDGVEKVTGQAQFTNDLAVPGMLHAALVKSTVPKGQIRSIDPSAALALPGVKAVVTARDLVLPPIDCPDIRYGVVVRDRPILAEESVRFVGEPVAAVVADDRRTAREAADLVTVDIEPEPAAVDLPSAMEPDAPIVHPHPYDVEDGVYSSPIPLKFTTSNITLTYETSDGDVDAAFLKADRVFEESYTFPAVYHYAMEPYCVIASVTPREMTVWSSAQHPYQVTRDLSRLFGYPVGKVRVIATYVGGAFGSKSFTHVEPLVVALARKAGRPVKLELDIAESMTISRRHNAQVKVRIATDPRGNVVAYDAELHYDTGAYSLLGPYVAVKGAFRALGGYDFPNYRVRSSLVFTNTSPAGSFRAIGGPQGAWALESALDTVAAELGIDRFEYRRRHVAASGAEFRRGRTPMDADLKQNLDELEAMATEAHDHVSSPGPSWRVGSGMAMGICDPGASPVTSAFVRLAADGSLTVTVGSSELGQGVRTVVSQVAAEALGVSHDKVAVMQTDTGYGPYDASTGASRSTTMSGLATYRATCEVRKRVAGMAAAEYGCAEDDLTFADGHVHGPGGESRDIGAFVRDHFGQNGGNFFGVGEVTNSEFPTTPAFWEVGAGAASVAVDGDTGEVRVLAYSSVADLGTVINPTLMEGQEEGAFMQGLGHTLYEAMEWQDGQPMNSSMLEYRVPRFADLPGEVHGTFVENRDGPGPYGAKGGGEGAIVPVAGALASAVYDACGVRVRDLPMTPERMWRALAEAGVTTGDQTRPE